MRRVNVELMKAGLRGMSIVFSSGDSGADCTQQEQQQHKQERSTNNNRRYRPQFPASSPYVTSVGGTGLTVNNTENTEYAEQLSGGGFSNVFARPQYQQQAVKQYLSSQNFPSKQLYNTSGRAYPDVAALCIKYWMVVRGVSYPGGTGTSASTPTVAGIVSMLNEYRLQANKPPMGFLNPFIYKNSAAFFDVTSGCNFGCNVGHGRKRASNKDDGDGFCAVKGFDPVTGHGTPNFPELVKAAMAVFS